MGLGTTLVECPLCWHAIEVPLHADMGKRVGDHVELTVTADAEPIKAHITAHTHEVVHLAQNERGTMACCGRTPFELPRTDRMTFDPTQRTCQE